MNIIHGNTVVTYVKEILWRSTNTDMGEMIQWWPLLMWAQLWRPCLQKIDCGGPVVIIQELFITKSRRYDGISAVDVKIRQK